MAERIQIGKCAVEVVQGDITRIAVDAIVNAANSALAGGGGVDGAIHDAGGPELMRELRKYDGCPTGSAVVTGAGRLPAKYVFHAVGPVYQGGNAGEASLLASCYRKSLQLAAEYQCQSISFPAISTGVYGYPIAEAARVALTAIKDTLPTLDSGPTTIKLVQFSARALEVYRNLVREIEVSQSTAQTS
jgi:O-acetyl-ADP-ribose deacetylase (regulator of RNase III)